MHSQEIRGAVKLYMAKPPQFPCTRVPQFPWFQNMGQKTARNYTVWLQIALLQ